MKSIEIIDLIVRYQKSIESILDQGIEQFLTDYIEKYKKVKKGREFIYIQLWTPNWNDGELCENTSDWCSGREIIDYEHYKNQPLMFQGISEEEVYNSYTSELDFINLEFITKVLQHKYKTNKQCLIIIDWDKKDKNGQIVCILKDYDCGY